MDIKGFGWTVILGIIFVFAPNIIGRYAGHFVTVLLSVCFVFAASYLFVLGLKRRHRNERIYGYRRDMIFVGILWLIMSVVGEIIRRYAAWTTPENPSWEKYNILSGGLMGLMWLSELVAPCVFGLLMFRRHSRSRWR